MPRPRKSIRASIRADVNRWRVCFAAHPGRWVLTPISGDRPEADAIAWAKRAGASITRARTKPVSYYAAEFFDPAGPWATRMREKGHSFVEKYLLVRQGHLDNYVVPLFGAIQPGELTRRQIDDAILSADRASGTGKPLSGATRNKIVYSFHLLLEDLVDRGVIERNPLEGIVPYSKAPTAPREALPRDALAKLFPASHGAMVRVWGGPMWSALMLVLVETGIRPGEARALRWAEWYAKERFFPIRHAVESGTTDRIKGTKTGIVKPAYVTTRTAQELAIWRSESRHADDTDFIFTISGDAPITSAGIVKAFRRGIEAVGIASRHWTPYYLRHSFGTYQLETLTDDELMLLMGHTNIITSRIYRHPDDMVVYRQGAAVKEKLDKARGEKHEADA